MKTFIKYSLPVIFFFITGDFLTTLWGLQAGGIETNPIMAGIVTNPAVFMAAKLAVLPVLYLLYQKTTPKKSAKIYFVIPALAGILLVINNIYYIFN